MVGGGSQFLERGSGKRLAVLLLCMQPLALPLPSGLFYPPGAQHVTGAMLRAGVNKSVLREILNHRLCVVLTP